MKTPIVGFPTPPSLPLLHRIRVMAQSALYYSRWTFWDTMYSWGWSRSPAYHMIIKPLMRKHGFQKYRP